MGDDFPPSTCSLSTPEELDGDKIRIALGCLTDKSAVAWYEVAPPTFVEAGSVFATSAEQIEPDVPQSEAALGACPNKLQLLSADQVEIDTLFASPELGEVVEPAIVVEPRQVWRTKFVRKLKVDLITRKESYRSRLVCVEPRYEQGHEFDRREVPTPLWSIVLILIIAECTVSKRFDFQFDMKQFFQQTPDGDVYLLPPPRYQKKLSGHR